MAERAGGVRHHLPPRAGTTRISASGSRRRLKLYFVEVGLASHLVRIKAPEDLWSSPHRGLLFENAAVVEAIKHCHNHDLLPDFYFLRTGAGFECDLLYDRGDGLVAIEIKAGATLNQGWFDSLARAAATIPGVVETALVYGGADEIQRSGVPAVAARQVRRTPEHPHHPPSADAIDSVARPANSKRRELRRGRQLAQPRDNRLRVEVSVNATPPATVQSLYCPYPETPRVGLLTRQLQNRRRSRIPRVATSSRDECPRVSRLVGRLHRQIFGLSKSS